MNHTLNSCKNISLGADSAGGERESQPESEIWGKFSSFGLEKLWSCPGFQEFCHSAAIQVYLSFIYPFLGPHPAKQMCKQWILGGWTRPQLDFCPCWGWTLWAPSIPNLSLSVSSSAMGANVYFEFHQSFQTILLNIWVLGWGFSQVEFWGCFPGGLRRKMTQLFGICCHHLHLGYTPSWGTELILTMKNHH